MTQANNQDRAKFITLEGGEGVGKSTNLTFIQNWLIRQGKAVCATREPGGTAVGEKIRAILLAADEPLAVSTELLLMVAARAEHVERVIRPALTAGVWVVSDRFCDASYAYQGGGRGIATEFIDLLSEYVQGGLQPDLTLLLDAPVAVGMARARKRQLTDRFEIERTVFFENVRAAYLQRAQQSRGRIQIIDASQSLHDVQQQIILALEQLISCAGHDENVH